MNLNNMEEALKRAIECKTTLPELVDAFESTCRAYLWFPDDEDDLLLFEAGNYNFTGTPTFQFSLTRQIPDGKGEYLQLRLTAHYPPIPFALLLHRTVWSRPDMDFFAVVRGSRAYARVKDQPILAVDCYTMDTD